LYTILQMKFFNKEFFTKILNALIVTFAISALFHLTLVTLVSLAKRDIAYLNPLDFLGVSILLPQYRNSTLAAGLGWLVLVALFMVILLVRIKYHWYVSFIKENRWHARIKDTAEVLSKKLLAKIL
jgi:hypothetical protein